MPVTNYIWDVESGGAEMGSGTFVPVECTE